MKPIQKTVAVLLIACIMLTTTLQPAQAETTKACKASPGTMIKILTKGMTTMTNAFPIRIAGIKLFDLGGVDDYDTTGASSMPLCICTMPPPIFLRIGLKFSMWEPAHIIETVKHPWCSPTVGLQLPININKKDIGTSQTKSPIHAGKATSATAQSHLIAYPLWVILGLFLDIACFQYAKSFDYLYVTEIDPLYQNDMWATLLGPEAYLVANPLAQFACVADSVKANINRPIDPLFWCVGSWSSSVYPMSKNQQSPGDYVVANAALSARLIAKLHREMLLWGTTGTPTVSGTCQRYPMPMWMKKQYNMYTLYPVSMSKRQVIGRTGLRWSFAKNPAWKGDDFVWMVYNKRDCCLF